MLDAPEHGRDARVAATLRRLSGASLREQALSWLAVLTFVLDAFALGQMDPVNLFLVTAGLVWAREGRAATGASLIGLAGMIKVLPVAFWGVLLVRRRAVGAVAGALLTLVAGTALLTVFGGWVPGLHSIGEWLALLREREGPWGLVDTHNSLRHITILSLDRGLRVEGSQCFRVCTK